MNKRELGQYYTINNPFNNKIFIKWFNSIPNIKNEILLEPFAGSNNIVKMINDIGINNDWVCFDINSKNNVISKYQILYRDTILNYPKGFNVVITNPPYLAKNSASRRNIPYYGDIYDDLYKKCLELMLNNNKYIAVIIPESFITSNIFMDKIDNIISITNEMFNDTQCPVCLSLLSNTIKDDFKVYRNEYFIGNYKDISIYNTFNNNIYNNWIFNDKNGSIGIFCCDNNKEESIRFVDGDIINPNNIKKLSSRAITRINGLPKNINKNIFINECNKYLKEYRKNTNDIFLTSFKGLRKDGKYRRRLDFKTARNIMNKVLEYF